MITHPAGFRANMTRSVPDGADTPGMTRIVEIRSYRLVPGAWPELRRHFAHAALPLLERAAMDVVAFGRTADDPDSAFLIRSFADLTDREVREAAFYGSPAWRDGPRAAILACIDTYLDTVLELDEATVDGLRAVGIDGGTSVTPGESEAGAP
jgi:hypothetical protein